MLAAAALCVLCAGVCLRQAARGWDVASNGLAAVGLLVVAGVIALFAFIPFR